MPHRKHSHFAYHPSTMQVNSGQARFFAGRLTLDQFLIQRSLSSQELLALSRQVIEKYQAIHAKQKIHSQITFENIYYHLDEARIMLAKNTKHLNQDENGEAPSKKYTAFHYAAPEIEEMIRHMFDSEEILYSTKTDVYALGVILKSMFGITPIVAHDSHRAYHMHTVKTDLKDLPAVIALTDSMTHCDPKKRPTLDQVAAQLENIQKSYQPKGESSLMNRILFGMTRYF